MTSLAKREVSGHRVITLVSERLGARQKAKKAAEREERFRQIQADFRAQRTVLPVFSTRSIVKVARGGAMDPALIEDRDYDYDEVVGAQSHFRFRLIAWGAG
jgi:hypothetical protein